MFNEIKGADFGSGFLSRILGVGGSVARARAANVSMIRFTLDLRVSIPYKEEFGAVTKSRQWSTLKTCLESISLAKHPSRKLCSGKSTYQSN